MYEQNKEKYDSLSEMLIKLRCHFSPRKVALSSLQSGTFFPVK